MHDAECKALNRLNFWVWQKRYSVNCPHFPTENVDPSLNAPMPRRTSTLFRGQNQGKSRSTAHQNRQICPFGTACACYDPRVRSGAGGWRGRALRCVRPEPLAIGITQTLNLFHALVSKTPGSIQTPLIIFSTKYSNSLQSVLKSELKTRCNPITHKPNNPLYWDESLRSEL